MKAVVHERYGPPDVLRVAEVERPAPKDDEVLVRVHSSTVTRGDTELRSLAYPFLRPATGIRRPRRKIAGTEFAGRIEQVGAAITALRIGDDVFGLTPGANAEYVTVREAGVIAPKPTQLTYDEAAAVPDGSLIAFSILQTLAPLEHKSVVVYGAAGSIGTAAVQLLVHHYDADVTAVCDTKDVELVRSLGAREVVDRLRDDFTKRGRTYDVILDAVGKHRFLRCRRSLVRGGVYVTTGSPGSLFRVLVVSLVTRVVGSRRAKIGIGRYRREDLLVIRGLVEEGKLRPVIDRRYGLGDAVDANRYVETGRKTGNVVLRIDTAS